MKHEGHIESIRHRLLNLDEKPSSGFGKIEPPWEPGAEFTMAAWFGLICA